MAQQQMDALDVLRDRFTEILENKEPIRTNRLINLMQDICLIFDIPEPFRVDFEHENTDVMDLYRAVTRSVDIDKFSKGSDLS